MNKQNEVVKAEAKVCEDNAHVHVWIGQLVEGEAGLADTYYCVTCNCMWTEY